MEYSAQVRQETLCIRRLRLETKMFSEMIRICENQTRFVNARRVAMDELREKYADEWFDLRHRTLRYIPIFSRHRELLKRHDPNSACILNKSLVAEVMECIRNVPSGLEGEDLLTYLQYQSKDYGELAAILEWVIQEYESKRDREESDVKNELMDGREMQFDQESADDDQLLDEYMNFEIVDEFGRPLNAEREPLPGTQLRNVARLVVATDRKLVFAPPESRDERQNRHDQHGRTSNTVASFVLDRDFDDEWAPIPDPPERRPMDDMRTARVYSKLANRNAQHDLHRRLMSAISFGSRDSVGSSRPPVQRRANEAVWQPPVPQRQRRVSTAVDARPAGEMYDTAVGDEVFDEPNSLFQRQRPIISSTTTRRPAAVSPYILVKAPIPRPAPIPKRLPRKLKILKQPLPLFRSISEEESNPEPKRDEAEMGWNASQRQWAGILATSGGRCPQNENGNNEDGLRSATEVQTEENRRKYAEMLEAGKRSLLMQLMNTPKTRSTPDSEEKKKVEKSEMACDFLLATLMPKDETKSNDPKSSD